MSKEIKDQSIAQTNDSSSLQAGKRNDSIDTTEGEVGREQSPTTMTRINKDERSRSRSRQSEIPKK